VEFFSYQEILAVVGTISCLAVAGDLWADYLAYGNIGGSGVGGVSQFIAVVLA